MVEVTEVVDDETIKTIPLLQSEERTLDANEIESLAQKYASRPSVKAHLESLVQKIRRDAYFWASDSISLASRVRSSDCSSGIVLIVSSSTTSVTSTIFLRFWIQYQPVMSNNNDYDSFITMSCFGLFQKHPPSFLFFRFLSFRAFLSSIAGK